MDAMDRPARLTALLAGVALLVLTLGAAGARAEDTFRFDNETGQGFTAFRNPLPECWSGESGVLAGGGEPRLSGQIHADVAPFDGCEEFWGAVLSYGQNLSESYVNADGESVWLWKGGVGAFYFAAEDPVFGPSTLSCRAIGAENAENREQTPIENSMISEVEGTTCVVEWLPGAEPGRLSRSSAVLPADAKYTRFVSSLATVKAGAAAVSVQTFARRSLGVEDEIVLRTRGGSVIGHARARLRVGARAKQVRVPLAAVARRELAKRGYLVVKASIQHVDGSPGSGDTTSRLVLRSRARGQ